MEIISVRVGSPSQTPAVNIENPSQVNATLENVNIQTGGTAKNAVLYDPQDLTDAQKQQARENINAAEKNEIPTKTSDLTNDSGFITKAVNDLVNYYQKSETYSKAELDNKISAIPKFSIEVVGSLPTTGISDTTVYLVVSGNEENNLYTEYIYVNGAWESLGKQTVDLTGYVKRTELSSYYTKDEIASLLEAIRNSIPSKTSQLTDDIGYAKQKDVDNLSEEIADLKGGGASIPDYWKTHLDEKIALIKEAQDKGGKDAVSYIVITDMHYPSNLGKIAPLLAKYIMDRCNIKFVLILGDTRNRGLHATKEACETEWNNIDIMLQPVLGKVLMTQGNHDAGYGSGDYDGDGDNDTFAYEFTPAEMFNRVYRKAGMAGNVQYDASGTAYYIDDESNKTRYILLNTQLNFDGNAGYNSYETVNGMAKYPSMWIFRYTQCQYDFLINDALATVPDDDWKVVMGSHIPINQTGEMPEFPVMIGVLQAYKNKTTYSGTYAGTAEGGSSSTPNFTNMADPTDSNFLDNTTWYNNVETAKDGSFISNFIPAQCANKNADIIRVAGAEAPLVMKSYDASFNELTSATTEAYSDITFDDNGVATWKAGYVNNYISTSPANNLRYIRVCGTKLTTAEDIVITVNEEITYTEGEGGGAGYDAVSVECDFTNAKGDLVAYHGGHNHADTASFTCYQGGTIQFPIITTRCDSKQENDSTLNAERVEGTITEQSFDVFTYTPDKLYATKIGAGSDREIAL